MAPATVAAKVLTGLVILMHVTAMLYLVMLTTLMQTSSATDLVTIQVYKPQVTSVMYIVAASLHFYALCSMVWQRRRSQAVGPVADVVPRQRRGLRRRLDNWYDQGIIVFGLVEIASECYQSHAMFKTLVEPSKVISYAVVVVINCFGSPLLLYIRNTSAKVFLVNVADAVVSFILSCGHPLMAVTLQLIEYVLVNPNTSRQSVWSTQVILLTRLLVPSSELHLAAMLALHVGTYLALRRVLDTTHHIHLAFASVFVNADAGSAPSHSGSTAKNVDQRARSSRLLSIEKLVKLTQQKRVLIHFNLVFKVVLGIASIVAITRSVYYRTPCPSYCGAFAQPLFDLSCNCAFININCVALGIQDPLPLLDPGALGTNALYMELRRCDLPSGIPAATLAPFQGLSKVMILFSNLSSWDGPVPPALNDIVVRYSQLRSVPRVFIESLSPNLIAISLEHCNLTVIPDHVLQAWKYVKLLALVNISLQEFPSGLLDLQGLEMLNLQGNQIQTLPRQWVEHDGSDVHNWAEPKLVYLGGNLLDQVPMELILQGAFVDLSGNPIPPTVATASIQPLIDARQVLLDATPLCANLSAPYCQPSCAPRCYVAMLGDYSCDLECFVPACGLDLGDCDPFGLTYET